MRGYQSKNRRAAKHSSLPGVVSKKAVFSIRTPEVIDPWPRAQMVAKSNIELGYMRGELFIVFDMPRNRVIVLVGFSDTLRKAAKT